MNFKSELTKGEFCIPECVKCKKIVWPPSEFCSYCFEDIHLKKGDFEGKIIEFSRQKDHFFCMVEFENTVRIMADMTKMPKIGQSVRISNCGITNGQYFFQVT